MRQTWHDLLFAHWPVPADQVRPYIPPGLELDTFDDTAWLSVVPFRMSGVRPRHLPAVPWLSAFPELNLRTYVRRSPPAPAPSRRPLLQPGRRQPRRRLYRPPRL